MTRNRLFMIMLLCFMFLAGWVLGCRSGVSAATSSPRIEYTHGDTRFAYTVQYGDDNKLYQYSEDGTCHNTFIVTAPGATARIGPCN
jgi:hypothetical protein